VERSETNNLSRSKGREERRKEREVEERDREIDRDRRIRKSGSKKRLQRWRCSCPKRVEQSNEPLRGK
jgi:hypothetical protein